MALPTLLTLSHRVVHHKFHTLNIPRHILELRWVFPPNDPQRKEDLHRLLARMDSEIDNVFTTVLAEEKLLDCDKVGLKIHFDDAWGNEFQYFSPGTSGDRDYEIISLGKDGQEGGEDADGDIRSWEASISEDD